MKKFATLYLWFFGAVPLIGVMLVALHMAQRGNSGLLAGEMLVIGALWIAGSVLARRSANFGAGVEASVPCRVIEATLSGAFDAPRRLRRWAQRPFYKAVAVATRAVLSGAHRRHAGRQSGSSVARRTAAGSKGSGSDDGDGGEPPHRTTLVLETTHCCTFGGAA